MHSSEQAGKEIKAFGSQIFDYCKLNTRYADTSTHVQLPKHVNNLGIKLTFLTKVFST